MSCAGASGASCKIAFRMTVTEKFRGRHLVGLTTRARTRKIVVTVGSATVTLAAGTTRTVRISLNRKGKRLLGEHHRLKVRLVVTQVLALQDARRPHNHIQVEAASEALASVTHD